MYPFIDDAAVYIPVRLTMVIGEKSERILVGTELEIDMRLADNKSLNSKVYYDKERPIGSFLRDFDDAEDDDWKDAMFFLCEAIEKKGSPAWKRQVNAESRSELEEKALLILKRKYESNNPVWMYASLQMWFRYCVVNKKKLRRGEVLQASKELFNIYERLLYPIYGRTKGEIVAGEQLTREHALYAWTRHKKSTDMQVIVSYPSDRHETEYASTLYSLLGVKAYYAQKLGERNRLIALCDVCGKYFLTEDKRQRLCCDACQKVNAKARRKERRMNPGALELDRLNNRENKYWDTRIEKLKGDSSIPENRVEEALKARMAFRTEQKEKRKAKHAGTITAKDLRSWFIKQREIIDSYMDD